MIRSRRTRSRRACRARALAPGSQRGRNAPTRNPHLQRLSRRAQRCRYPLALPEIQVCEAENIDWFTGMIARRRSGAINISMAGSSLGVSIRSLHRFLPTNLENDQQLFAFARSGAGTVGQCARSVFGVWTPVAMLDPSQSKGIVEAVSFNYKLFVAHKNINDKLEIFDPLTDTTGFRLASVRGTDTRASRRSVWSGRIDQRLALVHHRSHPASQWRHGCAVGAQCGRHLQHHQSTGWRVTRRQASPRCPTPRTGKCTEAQRRGDRGYLLATCPWRPRPTPTRLRLPASRPRVFRWRPWPGASNRRPTGKYLLADEARLLIGGSHAIKAYESRVWWTPVLTDASGVNNDERVNLRSTPSSTSSLARVAG